MLAMTDINTIRNLRNNHDKSINHIAEELEINWRTAKSTQMKIFCLSPRLERKRAWCMWNTGEASLLSGFLKILSCRRRSAGPLTLWLRNWRTRGSPDPIARFVILLGTGKPLTTLKPMKIKVLSAWTSSGGSAAGFRYHGGLPWRSL